MAEHEETIQVGAGWIFTDRNGNKYLSCSLNNKMMMTMFKNVKKTNPKSPDYNILMTKSDAEALGISQRQMMEVDDL